MSKVFLLDALDIVASYLFDRNVDLEVTPLGYAPATATDETGRFLVDLEARHVIACATRLRDVLHFVEQNTSTSRGMRHEIVKGNLSGRLDYPRYIARKYVSRDLPRLYPVIISKNTADTPENMLTKKVIAEVAKQLGHIPYPDDTAEGRLTLTLYRWLRARLRQYPWSALQIKGSTDQIYRSAFQRVRKHQTGNHAGYTALLEWFREWRADVKQLNREGVEHLLDGLLAFPQGDFFWNKVFEIWCLKEAAKSCLRCGCSYVQEPVSLNKRGQGPIYRMQYAGNEVCVWFQRQKPLTDRAPARWVYATRGQPLRGIPDIVITCDKRPPYLMDAKYRHTDEETSSEETYKMLGYLENYRSSLSYEEREGILQGVLMFVGPAHNQTVLRGPIGGRLALITVQESLGSREDVNSALDNSIREWLVQPSNPQQLTLPLQQGTLC